MLIDKNRFCVYCMTFAFCSVVDIIPIDFFLETYARRWPYHRPLKSWWLSADSNNTSLLLLLVYCFLSVWLMVDGWSTQTQTCIFVVYFHVCLRVLWPVWRLVHPNSNVHIRKDIEIEHFSEWQRNIIEYKAAIYNFFFKVFDSIIPWCL